MLQTCKTLGEGHRKSAKTTPKIRNPTPLNPPREPNNPVEILRRRPNEPGLADLAGLGGQKLDFEGGGFRGFGVCGLGRVLPLILVAAYNRATTIDYCLIYPYSEYYPNITQPLLSGGGSIQSLRLIGIGV